jgi:hypothetical protein
VIAITQGEYLNTHLGSDFGQSIILALINTVGPSLVRFLVTLEFWRPATAERVETTKVSIHSSLHIAFHFCVRLSKLLNACLWQGKRRKGNGFFTGYFFPAEVAPRCSLVAEPVNSTLASAMSSIYSVRTLVAK